MPTDPHAITWGADCTGAYAHLLPVGIPAIWPYCTGTPDVVWAPGQVDHIGAKHVYRVNQGYQSPSAMLGDEFDIETGAWSADDAVIITRERRAAHWSTRIYCTWELYGEIKGMLADTGIDRSVFYRIADWNLSEHLAQLELHGDVYAGQWASPTTNPATLIPGTATTLDQAQADLNVLLPLDTGWQG